MNSGSISSLHTGGSLAFRIAGAIPATPGRLLLLSHGVGGNETNLAALAEQAADDTLVVLPRAPLDIGAEQYAWFPVSFGPQGRDPTWQPPTGRQPWRFIVELRIATGAPSRTVARAQPRRHHQREHRLTLPTWWGLRCSCRRIPGDEPLLADGDALARIGAFIGHGRAIPNCRRLAYRADAAGSAWHSHRPPVPG